MSEPAVPIHYTFTAGGYGDDDLRVTGLSGTEGLSELFRFVIDIASEDAEVDFSAIVGSPAVLSWTDPEGDRYVHGIVARLEITGRGERYARYRAELVPEVWKLTLRRNSRIFQQKTVADILAEVLDEAGLPSDAFRVDAQGPFATREFCAQYRESDWGFMSRLMEEEGIFYFFEHSDSGAVLVMADQASAHAPLEGDASIPYREPGMGMGEREQIYRFVFAQQISPGMVTMRDFDFKRPSFSLEVAKEADIEQELEYYDYPGEYVEKAVGENLAQVRLEELRTERVAAVGDGNVARFLPGYCFDLEDHPRSECDQRYLILRVQHWGSQEEAAQEEASDAEPIVYRNRFECTPLASDPMGVPFRPPRVTPRPKVEGPQTAIVVGPSGEEIYTDEHGRVKVQFHWDRLGAQDENSSCWIRVSQSWAGPGWGALYLPRLGQEVLIDFLEGDPDQPIIVGRVYNGENPPPYPLPDEKTKSTLKSDTSLGGGGSNEFRFEDSAGNEEIYLHGQKDWNTIIENDKTAKIGHDETLDVGNDRTRTVGNNEAVTIGTNRDKTVGSNQTETIGSNKDIKVGSNHNELIGANMTITVGQNLTEQVAINYAETVGAAMELTIGAAYTETVGAAKQVAVGANLSESVGAKRSLSVKDSSTLNAKTVTVVAKDQITIKTGKAQIVMKKNGDITIKGKNINVKGSGNIVMKAKKILEN